MRTLTTMALFVGLNLAAFLALIGLPRVGVGSLATTCVAIVLIALGSCAIWPEPRTQTLGDISEKKR